MKYLCMIYVDEKTLGALTRSESDALVAEAFAYDIEANDLNEAIRLASKIPPARLGGVEVRPIKELV